VDLYSALDDKHLVLKALRHVSHSLTCRSVVDCRSTMVDGSVDGGGGRGNETMLER